MILAKGDIFAPNSELDNHLDFSWDTFDWDVRGNNRYDELTEKYFGDGSPEFIVKKTTVSKWGDLKIVFENGFALEVFADISDNAECWRFFEIGSEKHIVVSSQGLQDEDK